MIAVEQLTKDYGAVRAVDDLSFTVPRGAVVGFLGPNGSGNSTTLRALLGLVRPTAGTARIDGRPYAELADPLRTVGAVLDAVAHPALTGRLHLRAPAAEAGASRARVDQLLELVELSRGRRPEVRRLLARDGPAPRPRARAARRPRGARPRRARQRPRSRGHPLAPRLLARAGRRGPHRPALQPCPERGREPPCSRAWAPR